MPELIGFVFPTANIFVLKFSNPIHLKGERNPLCLQTRFRIRPRKRFGKWHKNELTDDLKIISEYFGYSYAKAKQIQNLISSDQLNTMKEKLQKGGMNTKEK